MKQKGQSAILILLGILILVGVAGGAYFLGRQTSPKPQNPVVTSSPQSTMVPQNTPSPVLDETANWKTYTSKKSNFSFKYPDLLELSEVGFQIEETIILRKGIDYQIDIDLTTKAPSSLEEWLKQRDQETNTTHIFYSRELTLDGVTAIQRHEKRSGAGMGEEDKEYEIELVYIVVGERLMIISAPHSEEALEILGKMLTTFKF